MHGFASATMHGFASATMHGFASATMHGFASATMHGFASATMHVAWHRIKGLSGKTALSSASPGPESEHD
jgi:hypothetical protein